MSILKGVKDRIDVKVTAEVNSDNGRTIKVPFVITAKKPQFDERRDVVTTIDEGNMKDEDLVSQYLLGWHGLQGADGSEIPYNEETLAEVMAATEYRKALIQGIMTAIVGKDALAKN